MTIPGHRGGGDPPRHRSCDTSQISGEMCALGLLSPYAREVNTTGIRIFLVRKRGRPSVALALGFLLIVRLLLVLKGYL